ncbi:ParB family protein [Billgrantia endophytica]|uniref:Uncharacterized protein n=1 Tax=Billgrantia endophytica TaxID=2033802 RepID=A0A2N7U4F0_9GAMM|nr:ParB family protein [Halomonas endophytica]PMR75297.1 hypothetical protein C1H69_10250 [Halomonas endophytica]
MAESSPQDMTAKLLVDGFQRDETTATTLSDPLADTPMVVTLDQLHPYEHDPRITRNPRYDEIRASIRERGLDAPPAITRRPGQDVYIIRNGGNTRLAILKELWTETKDARFFRIPCLFRPWSERGEIIALTGHLAENELHGGLSFIERALAVEKVRELYEQEDGKSLSQSELARRLKVDGYPVPQPHISRMQDAVRYLLPAIPSVLYGGLGRHQVEQLTALRRAGERTWSARVAANRLEVDFPTLFQDVLATFDGDPDSFSVTRVQDELIGQMVDLLGTGYDVLALEIDDSDQRWRLLSTEPTDAGQSTPACPAIPSSLSPSAASEDSDAATSASPPSDTSPQCQAQSKLARSPSAQAKPVPPSPSLEDNPGASDQSEHENDQDDQDERSALLQEHIVSPVPTTERLQSIQRLVAEHTGDTPPDFEGNVLQAIPVQAGGLYPISDVWYIDPSLGTPERLRIHIAQFASEIAAEAELATHIEAIDDGIGFRCYTDDDGVQMPPRRVLLALLHALTLSYPASASAPLPSTSALAADLAALLQGTLATDPALPRLSDDGLVKLFRLIRLARYLLDIEAGMADGGDAMPGT